MDEQNRDSEMEELRSNIFCLEELLGVHEKTSLEQALKLESILEALERKAIKRF